MAGWEFGLECEAEWFPGSWMSRQRCAGRRGGARGGEMAFATMNASPPRISLKSEKISIYLTEDYDILLSAC